jgi:hypothetical protein
MLAAALLGLGLGRMTLGAADAAPGDKKMGAVPTATVNVGIGAPAGKDTPAPTATEQPKVDVAPAGPGNDLIVRQPLGSYTRAFPGLGKATVTFTENRIHVLATVSIETKLPANTGGAHVKAALTLTADADYAMNRESTVYGIITGVDIKGDEDGIDMTAIIGQVTSLVNDTPFSFRLRVDEDAIVIKEIKWGALGSIFIHNLLYETVGKPGGNDVITTATMIATTVSGKYKADPNPEKSASLPKPRKKS